MLRHTALAAALLAAPLLAPSFGASAQTLTPGQNPSANSNTPAAPQMVPQTPGQPGSGMAAAPNTTPSGQRGNTRVGQLSCDVSGSVGYVFGSTKDLSCEFRPSNGPAERYVGQIQRFGVDVGVTGKGTMVWTVVNTGPDIAPGSLAGRYGGVSSNVSAGLGLGSNALIGGSRDQVALQPLSLESNTGINVAAGIAEMTLRPAS